MSNLKKASDSGNNQVLKIKAIMASSHYAKQSKKFKLYCQVRLTNPDSSLNEIATIFHNQHQIKITKSGLNHYNIKIDQLYDLIK